MCLLRTHLHAFKHETLEDWKISSVKKESRKIKLTGDGARIQHESYDEWGNRNN